MRILVAPNAFKGCLTASQAARAMAAGVRRAAPSAKVDLMPVSDGGDGLMEVLLGRLGGRRAHRTVAGPVGKPRRACYALLRGGRTAVIEMARASGIAGLARKALDPLHATSFGTGELIRDALDRGARRIVIGMGGSATNDGGAGMAEALGARFYDAEGRRLPRGAEPLSRLSRVSVEGFDSRVRKVDVLAVSDVTNPLLGPRGSARVYGPQKGATPAMVRLLDKALTRYAQVLKRDLGRDVARVPGAGAAGGLGAGLIAFLGARIVGGADWVLDQLDADRRLGRADLVLTGEGRFDAQSFYGKAPIALVQRARRREIPAALVCGQADPAALRRLVGLGRGRRIICRTLSHRGEKPECAMREAGPRLRAETESVVREWLARSSEHP